MEVYNVPEQEFAETYVIQGSESNQQFSNPSLEQFEAMHAEGIPEYVVDQGLYYPTATNYGYICTGFESPGDWDDPQRIFGLDGQEAQYAGAQTENLPFVYYTPSYAYAHSPYNPYNPYIPGAMVGVDGPFLGAQQYYTIPSYENHSSSPAYFPMVVQSRSNIIANSTTDPFIDTATSTVNRADGPGPKHNFSSSSPAFNSKLLGPGASQTNSLMRLTQGNQIGSGSSKRSTTKGSFTSTSFSNPASSQIVQGGSALGVETISQGKALSSRSQFKVALSRGNGLSNFGSSTNAQTTVDKVQSKFLYGRVRNETKASPDTLTEQNHGPRIDKSKNQLTVRAYTTKAGDIDTQGNITIDIDQYNKDDFPVDYVNAKFFVIKSYSEDDVHKSIKYNVWSSTPSGNKKLNNAYEDAQRIAAGDSEGCPIFLFFSVNASGQFCGVAEMIGPVDFHKDMDFWQQDKWCGSFAVKWHIVKDVPNPNFRHIILENNDNKPVTNSRDTQEVRYKKGIEMLKICKNYTPKTSLLDDFVYYENRQKILQEEKARLLMKTYKNPYFVPVSNPPRKFNSMIDLPSKDDGKVTNQKDLKCLDDNVAVANETVGLNGKANEVATKNENIMYMSDGEANIKNALKIGLLTINPKQSVADPLEVTPGTITNAESSDVVTVPLKVNGFAESSGFITVGSIPLDPRVLQQDLVDGLSMAGTKKG